MEKRKKLPPSADIDAGNLIVSSLLDRADAHNGPYPLWHGWAIMDGFLAGASYARAEKSDLVEALREARAAINGVDHSLMLNHSQVLARIDAVLKKAGA